MEMKPTRVPRRSHRPQDLAGENRLPLLNGDRGEVAVERGKLFLRAELDVVSVPLTGITRVFDSSRKVIRDDDLPLMSGENRIPRVA